jgi:F-type H+-transporting ATPase subunit b
MNFFAVIAAGEIDPARSIHWLWPAAAELIYGSLASILIFGLLYKFAGPAVRKAMADRTAKIQGELDASAEARSSAESEAADIRRAAGDIASERQRLLADADTQAEALLSDGRARLAAEIADLEARAEADQAAAASRVGDELRTEISRLAAEVSDRLLADTLDDPAQQALIESFIQKVGSSS